ANQAIEEAALSNLANIANEQNEAALRAEEEAQAAAEKKRQEDEKKSQEEEEAEVKAALERLSKWLAAGHANTGLTGKALLEQFYKEKERAERMKHGHSPYTQEDLLNAGYSPDQILDYDPLYEDK